MGAVSLHKNVAQGVQTDAVPRTRLVEHRGQPILRLDLSGLRNGELPAALDQLIEIVSREPAGTVRLMVVGQGHIPINGDLAETVRRYASHGSTPAARATALVGATTFQKVLFFSLPNPGQRKRNAFDLEVEAMDWLVEQ
jgi:hypothetical protein